jgi:hypothetical protein
MIPIINRQSCKDRDNATIGIARNSNTTRGNNTGKGTGNANGKSTGYGKSTGSFCKCSRYGYSTIKNI